MENAYELRLAEVTDLDRVLELITGSARWLAGKGTDQWQRPWPDQRSRDARVRAAILSGKTWILMDGPTPVATITADWQGDPAPGLPELWTAEERAAPAVYAHRMAVRRDPRYQGRGFGRQLLDVVGRLGLAAYDAQWLRLDAWSTNRDLHAYYRGLGFEQVRIYREAEIRCPSGALFQKPSERTRDAATTFAVNFAGIGAWCAYANSARAGDRVLVGSED